MNDVGGVADIMTNSIMNNMLGRKLGRTVDRISDLKAMVYKAD